MDSVEVRLSISVSDYEWHYRQPGVVVWARAVDGRRIQFPAHLLRPFVSHNGIRGRFRIRFEAGRCLDIARLGD